MEAWGVLLRYGGFTWDQDAYSSCKQYCLDSLSGFTINTLAVL